MKLSSGSIKKPSSFQFYARPGSSDSHQSDGGLDQTFEKSFLVPGKNRRFDFGPIWYRPPCGRQRPKLPRDKIKSRIGRKIRSFVFSWFVLLLSGEREREHKKLQVILVERALLHLWWCYDVGVNWSLQLVCLHFWTFFKIREVRWLLSR